MVTIILYAHELEFDDIESIQMSVSIVQHKSAHTASPKPQSDL